jgi:hypothetical protein
VNTQEKLAYFDMLVKKGLARFSVDALKTAPTHIYGIDPHERGEPEALERIEEEGVNNIRVSLRNPHDFENICTVGGFLGDEWKGSVHVVHLKLNAVAFYLEREKCACCGRITEGHTS